MIPRREELVEDSTPFSPRSSDVSDESRFLEEEDFLASPVSPEADAGLWRDSKKPHNRLRHALGIALLLATVFLWTASNFLASVRHNTSCS